MVYFLSSDIHEIYKKVCDIQNYRPFGFKGQDKKKTIRLKIGTNGWFRTRKTIYIIIENNHICGKRSYNFYQLHCYTIEVKVIY